LGEAVVFDADLGSTTTSFETTFGVLTLALPG
jgi:hypothetical protein